MIDYQLYPLLVSLPYFYPYLNMIPDSLVCFSSRLEKGYDISQVHYRLRSDG